MTLWDNFLPRQPIGIRIVTAVIVAMSLVLAIACAFIYLRVDVALGRQVQVELDSLSKDAERSVSNGRPTNGRAFKETVQVYDSTGRLLQSNDRRKRLLNRGDIALAYEQGSLHRKRGSMFESGVDTLVINAERTSTPTGEGRVVVTALSRDHQDDALRALLIQLLMSYLATVLAAFGVGVAATRAALGPVEQYRRAVVDAGADPKRRLAISDRPDDVISRLGRTFNDLLGEIDRARARDRGYLADASHELRSPLAVITTEIEWARARPRTPEQYDEVLASLDTQARWLTNLCNTLLNLEELNSEGKCKREAVQLKDLVEFAALSRAITERDVEVAADDVVVDIDPRWSTLAIGNLVHNAVKHGQGTISVTATADQRSVTVTVTDEGEGIPESLGMRAFDRFARADASRSTPGTGLGLALVRAVADSHGGTVALVPGGVQLRLRACSIGD